LEVLDLDLGRYHVISAVVHKSKVAWLSPSSSDQVEAFVCPGTKPFLSVKDNFTQSKPWQRVSTTMRPEMSNTAI